MSHSHINKSVITTLNSVFVIPGIAASLVIVVIVSGNLFVCLFFYYLSIISYNCRFSHDVTKIETTKLLILWRFNFMMYKSSLKLLLIQIFAPNEFLVLR